MSAGFKLKINLLLAGLVALDVILSGTCLFLPDVWFRWFHGTPYVDPQALLRRTGAVWAAFTLLQLMALLRWQKHPHWLVLVAGVRLTEIFSDWTYLLMCSNITWFGRLGLLISPIANLAFGLILLRAWTHVGNIASAAGMSPAAGVFTPTRLEK